MSKSLITKVSKLDGPDREIDAAIAKKFGKPHGKSEIVDLEIRSVTHIEEVAERYTGSIDAAISLTVELLPWAAISATRQANGRGAAELWRWAPDILGLNADSPLWHQNVGAGTPATAVLVAMLRAYEVSSPSGTLKGGRSPAALALD